MDIKLHFRPTFRGGKAGATLFGEMPPESGSPNASIFSSIVIRSRMYSLN